MKNLCLFISILQFILQEKQLKGLIDAQNKAKHILSRKCQDKFSLYCLNVNCVRPYILISNFLSLITYFYHLLSEIGIISRNWAYINNNTNVIYAPLDDDRPCFLLSSRCKFFSNAWYYAQVSFREANDWFLYKYNYVFALDW